jgi:hypothetical protein
MSSLPKSTDSQINTLADELSRWLIVFRQHPYPIAITEPYLDIQSPSFGAQELARRKELARYISGVNRTEASAKLLRQSIPELNIGAVIVPLENPWKPEINSVLLSLGFQMQIIDKYEVWK